jgi:hypothetical protein
MVQDIAGRVAVHRMVLPWVKVTIPVVPPGNPLTPRFDDEPKCTVGGVAVAVMVVGARVTVRVVVAVEPAKLPSPE